MQLTKEEDLRNLLMIGGIEIFLPFAQEEAEIYVVVDKATTTEEGQPVETVRKEELEQVFETTQAEEENEHSEEWLNIFSQETEKTATWEFAEEEEEEADNISLADLYEQIEALERRVKVQSMHIQQVKLVADEEGMGDHSDLPICRKFLQLGRLHEQSQPREQLDEVIDMIRELMIRSVETVSKERLSRRKVMQEHLSTSASQPASHVSACIQG
jgi:Cu2+-containing amine oxidase